MLYFIVYRTGNRTAGGQRDIRFGITMILGILMALSTLVVLWPDHLSLRPVRGGRDIEPGPPAEPA